MTSIEVLDTAVKIGLSATIGAVGGYFLTKKNHRHEFDLAYFRRRQEIIEAVAEKFESLHGGFSQIGVQYSSLVEVLNAGLAATQQDRVKYAEFIKEIGEGLREMHILEGRLRACGAKEAAFLLQEYRLEAVKVNDMINLQPPVMKKSEVLALLDELFERRGRMYDEMAKAFKSV